MTFLTSDLKNFEQQMEIMNQNFLARFNEIKHNLSSMDDNVERRSDDPTMANKNSRTDSANSLKKTSK